MTKIIFWNVQRLGEGSLKQRKEFRSEYISMLNKKHEPDLMLFCEITSNVEITSDITLDKLVAVVKRDKTKNKAQLGYGLINNADFIDKGQLSAYELPSYKEIFGGNFGGGNAFPNQSRRKLVHVGKAKNTEIFMYHANASGKAVELVAWAALGIREKHKNFILIGDLNCSPTSLCQRLGEFKPKSDSIIVHSGKKATHDYGKILDYVVCSGFRPSIKVLDNQWEFQQSLGTKKG